MVLSLNNWYMQVLSITVGIIINLYVKILSARLFRKIEQIAKTWWRERQVWERYDMCAKITQNHNNIKHIHQGYHEGLKKV